MTNEPKFTPGPWEWEEEVFRSFCVFPTDEETAARTGFVCDIDSRSYEEGSANARLISKAPEMYKLLREIVAAYSNREMNNNTFCGLMIDKAQIAEKLLSQIDETKGE